MIEIHALALAVCRARVEGGEEHARASHAARQLAAYPKLVGYCATCAEPNVGLLGRLVELASGTADGSDRSVQAGLEIFNACSERKLTMAEALSGAAATLERERHERRAQTTEQGPFSQT
jgi:hypothetical protein